MMLMQRTVLMFLKTSSMGRGMDFSTCMILSKRFTAMSRMYDVSSRVRLLPRPRSHMLIGRCSSISLKRKYSGTDQRDDNIKILNAFLYSLCIKCTDKIFILRLIYIMFVTFEIVFDRSHLCSVKLHLFDQKCAISLHVKKLFSVIYCEM